MKVFSSILLGILFFLNSNHLRAQQNNTSASDTLTVYGNCGQCKERIEEAAYSIKGVKHAEWNKKTHLLTLVYNPSKTDRKKIAHAIALAGHDSILEKSSDKNYRQLPSCCAYRTGTCDHD